MIREYKHIKKSNNKIRVITYNILAPIATTGNKHKVSCSEECIKWKNRFNLIKKEVMNEDPDLICFQEAQTSVVYEDIFIYFNSKGYYGYYIPQTSPKVSTISDENNFGLIILFKYNKFNILKLGSIDYNTIANKHLIKNKLVKFSYKVMKRFGGLVLFLKDKETNKEFYLITVHLEANPIYDDIKNFQAYILMKYIEKISKYGEIPIILAGDFNSKPSSSAYYGITNGVSLNQFDMEDLKYPLPFLKTPQQFTHTPLTSCYKKVFGKEPKHTNYTEKFKATLDYIFVNSKVKILGVMEELSDEYIKKMVSIPDKNFPSDHFMQVADLELI